MGPENAHASGFNIVCLHSIYIYVYTYILTFKFMSLYVPASPMYQASQNSMDGLGPALRVRAVNHKCSSLNSGPFWGLSHKGAVLSWRPRQRPCFRELLMYNLTLNPQQKILKGGRNTPVRQQAGPSELAIQV